MVLRVSKRRSKEISGKFQKCFKGLPRKFQGCSKKDFRVLQGSFKGVFSSLETFVFEYFLIHLVNTNFIHDKRACNARASAHKEDLSTIPTRSRLLVGVESDESAL